MRFPALLPTVLATTAMTSALSAQEPRTIRIQPGSATQMVRPVGLPQFNAPRAVIGVTTNSGSVARDTLGVLVTNVRGGSPAEKAGLEEGNRIVSVNGVSLKLAAADIGDEEMAGVMSRRLSRELNKLKPGDDVDLRVYANGQTKNVRVKSVSPDDLYAAPAARKLEDRATLGVNIATTGNARDTIGVFVMSVEDGSPAAKAGIEEGSRIASINGVDVRARRGGDDELMMRPSTVSRLEREVGKVRPGDDVELRVYYNGQYRNVKVKAARLSDLPRHNSAMTIMGGDSFMIPSMVARIDGARMGDEVRRTLETARIATGGALEEAGRVLGRLGNRVEW